MRRDYYLGAARPYDPGRALMPRPRGVAKFTKRVSKLTKIAIFGLFACRNERNFVYLPCHFQPKTEDIVQNDDTMMETKTIKTLAAGPSTTKWLYDTIQAMAHR